MVNQRGQTVVEILLAATVVSVALTALVAIVTTAMAHNRDAKNRVVATRQAQEAIEWIRTIRDARPTWGQFESLLQDRKSPVASGDFTIQYLCLGNQINDVDHIAGFGPVSTEIKETTITPPNLCPTYNVSNSDYARQMKIVYDSTSPKSAAITVKVSWDAGSRTDSVTMEATLNEKN